MLFNQYIQGKNYLINKCERNKSKSKLMSPNMSNKSHHVLSSTSNTNISSSNAYTCTFTFNKNNKRSVSENLSDVIKEKDQAESVHSIRKRNFGLRKILREKKKKRNEMVGSFHKEYLKESLQLQLKLNKTKDYQDYQIQIPRFKNLSSTGKSVDIPKLSLTLNQLWSPCELSKGFAKRCRRIYLSKSLIEERREQLAREQDNYDSHITELNATFENLKNNKELLTVKYSRAFAKFARLLLDTREKESAELKCLKEEKMRYDYDIKKLISRIVKLTKVLDKYLSYRNLLICVKEKILKLPWYFLKKDKEKFEYTGNIKGLVETLRNYSPLRGCFTQQESKRMDMNMNMNINMNMNNEHPIGIFERINVARNEVARFDSYHNVDHKIFSSVENFIDTLKAYDDDTITLMSKLSQMKNDIAHMRKELEMVKNGNGIDPEITSKEQKLNALKIKNQSLQETFRKLIRENKSEINLRRLLGFNSDFLSLKGTGTRRRRKTKLFLSTAPLAVTMLRYQSMMEKEFQPKMGVLCNRIQKILKEMGLISESMIISDKYSQDSIYQKCLSYLKIYETAVYKILQRQAQYKSSNIKKIAQVENEIVVISKIYHARKQRKILEERREQIKTEILENCERVYVLPKRKVDVVYKPVRINQSKDQGKGNDKKSEPCIGDVISYSEEDL